MAKLDTSIVDTKSDSVESVQMTPLIDIVFQILIFFLVAAQIRIPEGILNSNLPKDRGDKTNPNPVELPPELKIRILADESSPEVKIFFEQYRCESIVDLENKLVQLGSEGMNLVPVIIDGQPDVPYEYVLGALNACVNARFHQVSFKAPPTSFEQ